MKLFGYEITVKKAGWDEALLDQLIATTFVPDHGFTPKQIESLKSGWREHYAKHGTFYPSCAPGISFRRTVNA
jgi:hypothetical protein